MSVFQRLVCGWIADVGFCLQLLANSSPEKSWWFLRWVDPGHTERHNEFVVLTLTQFSTGVDRHPGNEPGDRHAFVLCLSLSDLIFFNVSVIKKNVKFHKLLNTKYKEKILKVPRGKPKYSRNKDDDSMTYRIQQAILRGNFIEISAYIMKLETYQTNNFTMRIMDLEK